MTPVLVGLQALDTLVRALRRSQVEKAPAPDGNSHPLNPTGRLGVPTPVLLQTDRISPTYLSDLGFELRFLGEAISKICNCGTTMCVGKFY